MKKRMMPMLLVFLFLSACSGEEVQETTAPSANVSGVETKSPREVSPPSAGSPAQISGAATPSPSSEPLAPAPPSTPVAPAQISGHETPVFEAPQSLKKCAACHTFEKGGAKKVGPNLHGVYGAQAGKVAGFTYTDDFLKVFQGKTWDDQTLNAWIEDSKKMAPNSKMGIKLSDAQERASIIQYLRNLR